MSWFAKPIFLFSENSPPSGAQRLDMLVSLQQQQQQQKKSETPTKKVSFLSESDIVENERRYDAEIERRYDIEAERRFDANANNVNDEKMSRLERVERDPNVSTVGIWIPSMFGFSNG